MMPIRVIAISHARGAGSEAVARMVSERLGFRHVDTEIIAQAASSDGIDLSLLARVERYQPLRVRLLRLLERAEMGQAGMAALPRGELMTSRELHALVRPVIADLADEGNVVIVSDAASVTLAGREDVLRVLVTASPRTRARRLASAEALSERAAIKRVVSTDRWRARYLRRFHGIQHEMPTHYDLVLCTDLLGCQRAAEVIVHAAGDGHTCGGITE
jgi:cytidylate kinase